MADVHQQVRQTALLLISEGVWPTVAEVRARMGTGSNTTINNTLKMWRQEFLSKINVAARRPDWPAELAEAFEQIWQSSCQYAEQQLEDLKKDITAENETLKANIDKQALLLQTNESERIALLEKNTVLQAHVDKLQQEQAKMQSLLQAEQVLRAKQEERVLQLGEQIEQAQAAFKAKELQQKQAFNEEIQQVKQEAQQREALAYERLEGLRIRLYEQLESERQAIQQEMKQVKEALVVEKKQRQTLEETSRLQLLDKEREIGKQQGMIQVLKQQLQDKADQAKLDIIELNQSLQVSQQTILDWQQKYAELERMTKKS